MKLSLHLLLACAGIQSGISMREASSNVHQVPLFTTSELATGRSQGHFASILASTGLLAISVPSFDHGARSTALMGLCHCSSTQEFAKLDESDSITLGDGQTTRTTFATSTLGFTPLPLPDDLAGVCGLEVVQAMETLRDQVAQVSGVFLQAFDQLLEDPQNAIPLLQNSYGGRYHSVSSIVQAASNLEHFHVYSKTMMDPASGRAGPALKLHTDAGLFLAFVPAFGCGGGGTTPDRSFYLKDEHGNIQQAVFPPDSIAIMLGAGAEHWIRTSALQLKATRHSVQLQSGTSRAWYGMMHLVPEAAIVEDAPLQRTFGEMRQAMIFKNRHSQTKRRLGDDPQNDLQDEVSIGCGFSDLEIEAHRNDTVVPAVPARRRSRLQMVENADACNNSSNFYCWMSCLDIPSPDQAKELIDKGDSLYCLDPSVLASTGDVGQSQKPCTEKGIVGAAMNTNCMGVWKPTASGAQAQTVIVNSSESAGEEQYCYGGTSMYMNGFQWRGTACVIYLFPLFVLDSVGALVGACFFTIFFGIALEWVILQRRVTVQGYSPGYKRLAVSAMFYGLQLSMGYTIMLVVMIYSIPLFISVIIGIVSGHVLFSSSDAVLVRKGGEVRVLTKESDGPLGDEGDCCEDGKDSNTGHVMSAPRYNVAIPEGSTPCCQNAM